MASRINDIFAHNDSARFRAYLQYCRDDCAGNHPVDPNDEYRESDKRLHLVERALQGYERKHGVQLHRGRIYLRDRFPIAAAPDAVESDLIGITVHVRKNREKYRQAVAAGVTASMYRHAIAMMAVTRLPNWIHINYVENAEEALRKMHEHEVEFSRGRALDLWDSMIAFARRVQQQEAA